MEKMAWAHFSLKTNSDEYPIELAKNILENAGFKTKIERGRLFYQVDSEQLELIMQDRMVLQKD